MTHLGAGFTMPVTDTSCAVQVGNFSRKMSWQREVDHTGFHPGGIAWSSVASRHREAVAR